jgi:serine/threonine protein kinase
MREGLWITDETWLVGEKLAEGSFGNVYSTTASSGNSASEQSYVYKEYKEYAKPDAHTLAAFTDFYYDLGTNDRDYLDSICCWPHQLVEDEDSTSGFLMIQIPEKFYCSINFSSGPKLVEAKFEHLLLPDRLLSRRHIPLSDKERYKLLLSVVRGLNFFHMHGISMGDFSHSNLLFSLDDCSVFFLDCDSFSLDGATVFPQTETGNWGVRERYPEEELGTEKSDIYKLGLLALRLLMKSDNPSHYQASTNTERLPAQVDAGVKGVIENSLKDAPNRPPLAAWSAALRTAIVRCVSATAPKRPATASSAERASKATSTESTSREEKHKARPRQSSLPVTSTGSTPASGVFNVFPVSATSQSAPASAPSSSPPQQSQSPYKRKLSANPPVQQTPYPHEEPEEKKDGDGLGPVAVMLIIGILIPIILFAATRSCSTYASNSPQPRPAASQTQDSNPTGTIEISAASPSSAQAGVETTFSVAVKYTSRNTTGCIIYAGANTEIADSFSLYTEYVLPDTSGTYTFNFTCTPKKWDDHFFGIYVNISEYPHPDSWNPLDSDVANIKL